MSYRCLFSYYGGKSKIAQAYPAPVYDTVIEPFAGAASYSLRYHERRVVLNDSDPITACIWHYFLTTPLDSILAAVPETVPAGKRVSDIVDVVTGHQGLVGFLRAEANRGTQGANGIHDVITSMGAKCWSRLHPKIRYWWPRIQHWSLLHGDYTQLENVQATWFVDPPYSNVPGSRYRQSSLDYPELARWCLARRGQVVVCENEGATWLPFEPLVRASGVGGKNRAVEVMFQQQEGSTSGV